MEAAPTRWGVTPSATVRFHLKAQPSLSLIADWRSEARTKIELMICGTRPEIAHPSSSRWSHSA